MSFSCELASETGSVTHTHQAQMEIYQGACRLCVYAGKALFAEALLQGTMEGFFKLIEQYRTQDEPAFCGLARYTLIQQAHITGLKALKDHTGRDYTFAGIMGDKSTSMQQGSRI